jgi:SnoaL-like domain
VTDRAAVDRWLEAYVAAWKSYEPGAIGELFSEDVEYAYRPKGDTIVGRETVVRSWIEDDPDDLGTYDGAYEVYAVEDDRAVAVGTSTYAHPDGSVRAIYDNCFLLRFDAAGRCSQFIEWFMERPTP